MRHKFPYELLPHARNIGSGEVTLSVVVHLQEQRLCCLHRGEQAQFFKEALRKSLLFGCNILAEH